MSGAVTPPTWYPGTTQINSPMALGAATNNQLLIGTGNGHVYAYNVLTGALSQVENLPLGGSMLSWVGAYGGKRWVAWDDAVDNTAVSYWEGDSAPSTGGADVFTSAWDFDLPENVKILEGFHVVSDTPAAAGTDDDPPAKTVTISYMVDESGDPSDGGDYTDLVTLDSTNTTTGDNFLPVSNVEDGTQTFRILRYRIATTGGLKVYSVTARARVADTQEVWDLVLMCEEEASKAEKDRPSDQTRSADEIRTSLEDLAVSKRLVEFKDGYRTRFYGGANRTPTGGYSTHPVIVDLVEDFGDKPAEGKIHIRLKAAGALNSTPTSGGVGEGA